MIYLELLLTFFKIGLFTVGGGYAMLPLMQEEIVQRQWLKASEFVDIIAIAEMTPGAIAVNTATFVGYRMAGIPGSVAATAAIALPSLLIIIMLAAFWERHREHPRMKGLFGGIRPAVAGLIAGAAYVIGRTALLMPLPEAAEGGMDVRSAIIAAAAFCSVRFLRVSPIRVIAASAAAGLILFSL